MRPKLAAPLAAASVIASLVLVAETTRADDPPKKDAKVWKASPDDIKAACRVELIAKAQEEFKAKEGVYSKTLGPLVERQLLAKEFVGGVWDQYEYTLVCDQKTFYVSAVPKNGGGWWYLRHNGANKKIRTAFGAPPTEKSDKIKAALAVSVDASKPWQPCGVSASEKDEVHVTAEGEFSIGKKTCPAVGIDPGKWVWVEHAESVAREITAAETIRKVAENVSKLAHPTGTFDKLAKSEVVVDGNAIVMKLSIAWKEGAGGWIEKADATLKAMMGKAEQAETIAKAVQSTTHPTGTFEKTGSLTVSTDGENLVLEIHAKWKGGLTGGAYDTAAKWRCSKTGHLKAEVSSDNAMIAVAPANAKSLDDYFKDKVWPVLAKNIDAIIGTAYTTDVAWKFDESGHQKAEITNETPAPAVGGNVEKVDAYLRKFQESVAKDIKSHDFRVFVSPQIWVGALAMSFEGNEKSGWCHTKDLSCFTVVAEKAGSLQFRANMRDTSDCSGKLTAYILVRNPLTKEDD